MPLFYIYKNTLQPIEQKDFDLERELHNLIEANLETVSIVAWSRLNLQRVHIILAG